MGIIDDLIVKGKLKSSHISSEMVKKEYDVGKKTSLTQYQVLQRQTTNGQLFKRIIRYFMP